MDAIKEIFRGHVEECIRHLSKAIQVKFPKGSRESASVRQPIADFCGAANDTVSSWIYEENVFPVGQKMLKLMFFLEMLGFRVLEIEHMRRVRRNFAELIAHGLITVEQACEILGYSSNAGVLAIILDEQQGTSKEKEQKMWDAWKERKGELIQKKVSDLENYGKQLVAIFHTKEVPSPVVLGSRNEAVVKILDGLLLLLEESPDSLSQEELKKLGDRGVEVVLKLSARLNTLSSRILTTKQEKGGV